jgi:nicotinamidase-related amidase
MQTFTRVGLDALLTPENCAVLLIDHQPSQLAKPIDRTLINSWEGRRVVEAVKSRGRKKLVIAALWSEMCLAQPAIHAMGEGYDVYVVTDASGGVSPEAHDMAIRRLVAAGPSRSHGLAWPENCSVIGRAQRGSGRSPRSSSRLWRHTHFF